MSVLLLKSPGRFFENGLEPFSSEGRIVEKDLSGRRNEQAIPLVLLLDGGDGGIASLPALADIRIESGESDTALFFRGGASCIAKLAGTLKRFDGLVVALPAGEPLERRAHPELVRKRLLCGEHVEPGRFASFLSLGKLGVELRHAVSERLRHEAGRIDATGLCKADRHLLLNAVQPLRDLLKGGFGALSGRRPVAAAKLRGSGYPNLFLLSNSTC